MSSISEGIREAGGFRSLKKAASEPVAVTATAPVEAIATAATPVEATGTVQETNRKFESLTGRLFSNEGHSTARTWAVRVLSVALVFPVVLAAIADLGRGIGYLIGNKFPAIGAYFTGKSFSLIDEASKAVKMVSDKVKAVYKSYQTQDPEAQSKQALKAQAKKLVNGYLALNSGIFFNDFSTNASRKGEAQITAAEEALVAEANKYLARVATKTEGFGGHVDAVKKMIRSFISEAAGKELYIDNKVVRFEGTKRPFVRDVAFDGFKAVFRTHREEGADKPAIAAQFIEVAKKEGDVAKGLKSGIDQKILTPKQAKQAVETLASAVYANALTKGLDAANNAENALLDSAIANDLISEEEAKKIAGSHRAEVTDLAAAAAKDIAKAQILKANPDMLQKQMVDRADFLIQRGNLKPEDKTGFLTEAESQITAAKEVVQAEINTAREAQAEAEQKAKEAAEVEANAQREVQLQAEAKAKEIELKAKQEAEVAEAKRVAEVQKEAAQTSLFGKFRDFLKLIARKQGEVETEFKSYEQLDKELTDLRNERATILSTPAKVKGKDMNLLEAYGLYQAEENRILKNKDLTPIQKKEKINSLVAEGFDQKTIDLIQKLVVLEPKIKTNLDQMIAVSEKIQAGFDDLIYHVGVYKIFAENNKKQLRKEDKEELKPLEKARFDVQEVLNKKYKDLFVRETLQKLKPLSSTKTVNVDAEGNRTEVDAILNAESAKAESAEKAESEKKVDQPGRVSRILSSMKNLYDGVHNTADKLIHGDA